MKYNKASIDSAMNCAIKTSMKQDTPLYVFATGYGFRIANQQPPTRQSYYVVVGKAVDLYQWNYETEKQERIVKRA